MAPPGFVVGELLPHAEWIPQNDALPSGIGAVGRVLISLTCGSKLRSSPRQ
ncbi:hypothetical protein PVAP13_3KG563003 [Panicum virgatum]|uniref:Uncharacterized protein n=1 Tax=Panicum virgatum TaxID=38727 RepID=A0A8T0V3B4_PANVG|nr:hypothetical protein PVAP13_3KG563003 [Panicum virgatum]